MKCGFEPEQVKKILLTLVLSLMVVAAPRTSYAQSSGEGKSGLPLPRFASLKSGKANVRVGPGTDFKINWLYQKRGLPMEIIQEFDTWRKVRDPEGNEGWVLHSLLSGRRTVVVRPWEADKTDSLADLKKQPEGSAALFAKLQAGLVAQVKSCSENWCQVSVKDKDNKDVEGYIEKNELWGVYPDEIIED